MKRAIASLLLGMIAAPLSAQSAAEVRGWLDQMRDKAPANRAAA